MNLNLRYTGIRNLTLGAYLNNVFDNAERINVRSGNPAPRGRTLRVAMEYTF